MMEDAENLCKAIDSFVSAAQEIRQKAVEEFARLQNAEQFVKEEKLGMLSGLFPLYKQIFVDINVFDRDQLEATFKNFSQNLKAKEAVESFYSFEASLNQFLGMIDSQLMRSETSQKSDDMLVGDIFPRDIQLNDVRSSTSHKTVSSLFFGNDDVKHCIVVLLRHFAWLPWRKHVDQLDMIKEELEDESCSVIALSFGDQKGALQWLKETNTSFSLYTDENRNVYKVLGLTRSIQKSYNSSAMSFYGAAMARGETPPKFFENDDAQQMGGDFVVTKSASGGDVVITHIHRSEVSTDRPTIPFLLKHVKTLNEAWKTKLYRLWTYGRTADDGVSVKL